MRNKRKKKFNGKLDDILSGVKQLQEQEEHGLDNCIAQVVSIDVDQIIACRYQPRRFFQQEALDELAESIAQHGLIQPITVRAEKDGIYELIAGERRWRASKLAGLCEIPAIVNPVDDATVATFALIENIQREDLNPIDEATAIQAIIDERELTHAQVAELIGKSRSRVTNLLRLLELSLPVKKALESGKVSMGHAIALLALPPVEQAELLLQIIERKLNVRQTEKAIQERQSKEQIQKENPPESKHELMQKVCEDAELQLIARLRKDVKIKPTSGRQFAVTIIFDTLQEAQEFYARESVVIEQ